MKHGWILAGLLLLAGCGQTGALYLPQDDTQSPIRIRPVTEPAATGTGPATTPAPVEPMAAPAPASPPAAGADGERAPEDSRDGKPAGAPPPQPAH